MADTVYLSVFSIGLRMLMLFLPGNQELGFKSAAAVREGITLEKLERLVGLRQAHFLWGVCNGQDDSEVIQRREAKSLLAAKNFEKSIKIEKVVSWMQILARELVERMEYEEKYHRRHARTLTCSFRIFESRGKRMVSISRSHAMPVETARDRPGLIVGISRSLLTKELDGVEYSLPISFVGICATNFVSRATGKVCRAAGSGHSSLDRIRPV